MSTELTPAPSKTADLYRQSTDVAGVCREIVTKTAQSIQGRKYVRVEGWQSIATAHGCTASARDVERIEGGVRAIGEIRRMSDGVVIATAEGFVGEDEPVWFGGKQGTKVFEKRPDYAIRAMCQTRAISRACRTAFAHVVVLIDSNLSTTPAEEVPLGGFNDEPRREQPAPEPKRVTPVASEPRHPDEEPADNLPETAWRNVPVPKFIKNYAGGTLGDMEQKDVIWWANNYEPKPYKGSISEADVSFRAALTAAKEELTADVQY